MTSDEITRVFTPDLEIRSAAQGGDGRTIVGIAVPFNKPVRIDHQLVESIAPGAFNRQLRDPGRVRFSREHVKLNGSIIGVTQLLRNDATGLYGEFRVSKTPTGDETLELVRDGALRDLSIGFRPLQDKRARDGSLVRTSAHLTEVAIVTEGAYGSDAGVTEVRSGEFCGHDGCPDCGYVEPSFARRDEIAALMASLPKLSV